MPEFNYEKCLRCGLCQRDCVAGIIVTDAEGLPAIPIARQDACLHCQHCLAVCPVGAVSCDGVSVEDCQAAGPLPPSEQMLNLLKQRRSIRTWAPETLTEENLRQLCEPLNWTPTGSNSRMLHFVVVERSRLSDWQQRIQRALSRPLLRLLVRLRFSRYRYFLDKIAQGEDVLFRDAPYLLVAAIHRDASCPGDDPVIALSQFEVYAQTLGIGTCWCGLGVRLLKYHRRFRSELALPDGYRPAAAMLFGRPGIHYPRAASPFPPLSVTRC